MKEKCNECGKVLDEKKIVWLELSLTDGNYYETIPANHRSQGFFAFGKDCAKKLLNKLKSEE